jgi:hypothetical protein
MSTYPSPSLVGFCGGCRAFSSAPGITASACPLTARGDRPPSTLMRFSRFHNLAPVDMDTSYCWRHDNIFRQRA